jgi:hypothetical protein
MYVFISDFLYNYASITLDYATNILSVIITTREMKIKQKCKTNISYILFVFSKIYL